MLRCDTGRGVDLAEVQAGSTGLYPWLLTDDDKAATANAVRTAHDQVRPTEWSDFVGQERAVRRLRTSLTAAKNRGDRMEHVFLCAEPGTGKTTLAALVAHEIGAPLIELTRPADDRRLVRALFDAEVDDDRPGVLFVDEALSVDTPVPTPAGWTTMGDIKVGDQVLGQSGPTNVVAVTEVAFDRPCYELTFADRSTLVADAGHLWSTRPADSHHLPWRTWTTQQVVDNGRRFAVPRQNPVGMEQTRHTVDPYVMGFWLGNGSDAQPHVIVRAEDVDAVLNEIQRFEPDAQLGKSTNERDTCFRVTVTPRKGSKRPGTFTKRMRALGVWGEKHIPESYLRGSIEQRLALIQGLMDTDGYISPQTGYCTFRNSNERIIDGFVEVIRSLGYIAHKTAAKDDRIGARGPHAQSWGVYFSANAALPPFRAARRGVIAPRKNAQRSAKTIVSIQSVASVPVRCIAVDADDHLFLAGHGWTVTHNCHQWGRREQDGLLTLLEQAFIDTRYCRYYFGGLTVIAATTDRREMRPAVLDRFGIDIRFEKYTVGELAACVDGMARRLDVELDEDTVQALAVAADGSPRAARRLVQAARDLTGNHWPAAEWEGKPIPPTPAEIFDFTRIRADGLTDDHIAYLAVLNDCGGQAGLDVITNRVGLHRQEVTVLERKLADRGYIGHDPRGRLLTPAGRRRLRHGD